MRLGLSFVLRRAFIAVGLFFAISSLAALVAYSSGNAFYNRLVPGMPPAEIQEMMKMYGVGVPIYVKYFIWLTNLVRGNLGISLSGIPVSSFVPGEALATLQLVVPATIFGVAGGLYLGLFSARHRGSWADHLVTWLSTLGYALPVFWIGILAIYIFSFSLGWLPSFGIMGEPGHPWWGNGALDRLAHMILPVSMLTLGILGTYTRIARTAAAEVLEQEWVTAYSVAGIKRSTIVYRHCSKSVLATLLPYLSASVGTLLSTVPGVEIVFNWPGIGYQFVHSAVQFDQLTVLAIVELMVAITLSANLIADIVLAWLDPRVRLR